MPALHQICDKKGRPQKTIVIKHNSNKQGKECTMVKCMAADTSSCSETERHLCSYLPKPSNNLCNLHTFDKRKLDRVCNIISRSIQRLENALSLHCFICVCVRDLIFSETSMMLQFISDFNFSSTSGRWSAVYCLQRQWYGLNPRQKQLFCPTSTGLMSIQPH